MEERRSSISSKESFKLRYSNFIKDSGEHFVKNTMQIIPYMRQITPKDEEMNDLYIQRRYYNMEKLAFPLKDIKKELSSRHKYRTLMHKTGSNYNTEGRYSESQARSDRSEIPIEK